MPRYSKPALVNGREVRAIVLTDDDVCDYCGQPRCRWQDHAEARADVRAWQRELHRQEFPFGDYREGFPDADDF